MLSTRITRDAQPLSNESLMAVAPAIFAEAPRAELSERYSFIPTIALIDALRGAGWQPVFAASGRARDVNRVGVQKHVVRFSHGDFKLDNVGDSRPELVLTNSHDGTSACQFHAGIFVLVCGNGMIVADETFAKVSIRHSHTTLTDVVDASFRIVEDVPKLHESIDGMRAVQLTDGERRVYAEAASQLRWDADAAPVPAERLLQARHYEQDKKDLWSTLNVVQENLIRGGLRGRNPETGRRTKTRSVASVTEDTKLNKALWHLAEEMRKLKG